MNPNQEIDAAIPKARQPDDQRRNDAQGYIGLMDVMLAYINHPEAFDKEQLRINIEQAKQKMLATLTHNPA